MLVNDAHAGDFSATWVVCQGCGGTVGLSTKVPYELGNWVRHKEGCAGVRSAGASTSKVGVEGESGGEREAGQSGQGTEGQGQGQRENMGAASVSAKEEGNVVLGQKRKRNEYESEEESGETSKHQHPGRPENMDYEGTKGKSKGKEREVENGIEEAEGSERKKDADSEDRNANRNVNTSSIRRRLNSYIAPEMTPPGKWGWFLLPWESFKKGFSEGLFHSSTSRSTAVSGSGSVVLEASEAAPIAEAEKET